MLLLNQGRAHFSVKNRRTNIVVFEDHKVWFENVKGLLTHKQRLDLVPGLVCWPLT